MRLDCFLLLCHDNGRFVEQFPIRRIARMLHSVVYDIKMQIVPHKHRIALQLGYCYVIRYPVDVLEFRFRRVRLNPRTMLYSHDLLFCNSCILHM